MLDPTTLNTLQNGDHGDPFALLGMHPTDGRLWVRAMLPGALDVTVLDRDSGEALAALQRQEGSDLFAAAIPGRNTAFPYRLAVDWGGRREVLEDPYRFGPVLGDIDLWLLAEGKHLRPYEQMGAHPDVRDGVAGVRFAVWAPNARRVSVVGDFNRWDGRRHPMRLRRECGVWEIFLPGLAEGALYKFEIKTQNGTLLHKADPFARHAQVRPDSASIVARLPAAAAITAAVAITAADAADGGDGADAGDAPPARQAALATSAAVSIYEVHLGSWRRDPASSNGANVAGAGGWLSYRELAEQLVPYVRDLGFTHIELMPVHEHPFDGSWGYQPTGLYAPTARFGSPEDFQFLIDTAHASQIGVILDWVPGHFPNDAFGLAQFDGTCLYEHADPREGYHQDWNTLIYNFGRREVSNFLASNALYWTERFGIDALRVDAVASMLYRDYSRKPGEWVPNQFGGRENLEAIDFLRQMNATLAAERPQALAIAEESTAFPKVSHPTESGGLGFGYKWNMGWMHDTLEYMKQDPLHRKHHHDRMTFGLVYAYTENFVLPLSHDEVVHGKGSLLGKMPGDAWQRFANLRAYYGFMWGHPGKKLLFMGGEFAQPSEWNADRSLDWHVLEQPPHQGVQRLVRDLNAVYRAFPALHRLDCDPAGFDWITHEDRDNSALSFVRKDGQGSMVLVLCNFTPVPRHGYRIGVPQPGAYREILNTDATIYGGSGVHNGILHSEAAAAHGQPQSLCLTLPPLATVMLALA